MKCSHVGESKIKESAQKYESQSAELYKSKQSLLETSQIIDLLIEMETNGNVILTESNLVESNLCFEMKSACFCLRIITAHPNTETRGD